jgi:phage shock protein E
MRWLGCSVLAVAAVSFAAIAGADDAQLMTPRIDQASLLKRINDKDPSVVILDVRSPQEYAAGHIPGAINIPYTHLPVRISEIADAGDKDIVVYCEVGVRAEEGAARLRESGFTRLLHLDGDMKAWEESGRAVAK